MSLIHLIVYIAILGLIVWAITTLIPMPDMFKKVIYVVAVIVLILLLLSLVAPIGNIGSLRL